MGKKIINFTNIKCVSFWILIYLFIYSLSSLLVSLAFFMILHPHKGCIHFFSNLSNEYFNSFFIENSINIKLFTILLATLSYLILFKIMKKKISQICYIKNITITKIVVALAIGILLHLLFQLAFIVGQFVFNYFNIDPISSYIAHAEVYKLFEQTYLGLVILFIVSPIFEEFLFRGLIGAKLKPHFSFKVYIFLQALIFSLIHLHPLQILYTFLLGIVLGLFYEKHQSILSPIFLHIGFNLTNITFVLR